MGGFVSPADLARRLGHGTTERQVKDWARQYRWPHVRIGRKVFFTESQVDAIVTKHTVIPKQEPDTVIAGQTAKSASRSKAG